MIQCCYRDSHPYVQAVHELERLWFQRAR